MLKDIIPNNRVNFESVGLENFDYHMLMYCHDEDIQTDDAKSIIDKYNELDLKKYFMINKKNIEDDKIKNLLYTNQKIRKEIYAINDDPKFVVDVLIKYLYESKKSNYKTTLWSCFGDEIIDNIRINIQRKLSEGYIQCESCHKLIKPKSNRQKYCKNCWEEKERERQLIKWHKYKDKYRSATYLENR
jgi:hypothetical protein